MLKVSNLTKSFSLGKKKIAALSDATFEIKKGQIIGLFGPSGSGKTTLLNLISGLENPDSGKIFFKEKEITAFSQTALSKFRNRHIGYIFQDFLLINHLTLVENVLLPLTFSKKKQNPHEILKKLGLEHRLNHRPPHLSGGEKQRAAIARALINNPELILADEPTGNLDEKTAAEIIKVLAEIPKTHESTLLIATHDQNILKIADRTLQISNGKITAS